MFQFSPYVSDDTRLRGYLQLQLFLIHHVGGTSETEMRFGAAEAASRARPVPESGSGGSM